MKKFIIIIISLLFLSACGTTQEKKDLDEFAKCLTENEVTMYGTYWCSHCSSTKKKFGHSFQHINYIECDPKCKPDKEGKIIIACQGKEGKPELCLQKDIKGYPTWENKEGERIFGEINFEQLAEFGGCKLPD